MSLTLPSSCMPSLGDMSFYLQWFYCMHAITKEGEMYIIIKLLNHCFIVFWCTLFTLFAAIVTLTCNFVFNCSCIVHILLLVNQLYLLFYPFFIFLFYLLTYLLLCAATTPAFPLWGLNNVIITSSHHNLHIIQQLCGNCKIHLILSYNFFCHVSDNISKCQSSDFKS